MLSYDTINYPEVKLYVDTLPTNMNFNSFDRKEHSPHNFRKVADKSPD